MNTEGLKSHADDLRAWAEALRRQPNLDNAAVRAIEIEKAAALNEIAYALQLLAHKSSR